MFTPVESRAAQRSILLVLERNESLTLPPAQYLVLVHEMNRGGIGC